MYPWRRAADARHPWRGTRSDGHGRHARIWTHEYKKSPNWGGVLSTAGGLVFTGGTSDRKFHAFDAATGKLLWEFPMNSGALAPPSSFSIDGRQYVAVESRWGGASALSAIVFVTAKAAVKARNHAETDSQYRAAVRGGTRGRVAGDCRIARHG
jgi:outer membrane protein assembly factor BamB